MSISKMDKLQLSDKTASTAVSAEEDALSLLQKSIKSGEVNPELAKISLQTLNLISKMRINCRMEVSLKARIIKDLAKDKDELSMYIRYSFPKTEQLKLN